MSALLKTKDTCRAWERGQTGITVVELVIGLALFSLIIAGSFTAFSYARNGFSRVEASYPGIVDANTAAYRLGKEIMAAEPLDNGKYAAVIPDPAAGDTFLKGQRLDIYSRLNPGEIDVDGTQNTTAETLYKRISYQLVNNSELRRGWVLSSDKNIITDGYYNEKPIPNINSGEPGAWMPVLEGVTDSAGNVPTEIFRDDTSAGGEQRLITLNFTVSDLSGNKFEAKPVTISSQVMSRSKTLVISTGDVMENYIPVTGIEVVSPGVLITVPDDNQDHVYTAEVKVSPDNATVQGVIWNDPPEAIWNRVTLERNGKICTIRVKDRGFFEPHLNHTITIASEFDASIVCSITIRDE